MQAIWLTLYALLGVFFFLLIVRLVVEVVKSFARDWTPARPLAVLLEAIFTVTDPPLKFLRRLVPSVSLGSIRLDLSYLFLFLIIALLQQAVRFAAAASA